MASDPILELAEELLGDNTISIYVNNAERAERLMMAEHWVPATAEDIADRLRSRLRQVGGIGPSGRYSELPAEHLPKEFDLVYVLESKKGGA